MTSAINILFLGTGTSTGVPQIGCSCPVCSSDNPKNKRLRSSIYLTIGHTRLLLDSSPDLRQQALRAALTRVDAVLYTHGHVDHVGGFDDLRAFCWHRKGDLPMYGAPETFDILRGMYPWAFIPTSEQMRGYIRPEPHPVTAPFYIQDIHIIPLPVNHSKVTTYAYKIEAEGYSIVYMPDVKSIPPSSLRQMKGADILILDGLRPDKHPTHFCLAESLEAINTIAPTRAYLTHLSHAMDYDTLSAALPPHVFPAYDGLLLTLPPSLLD